MRPKPLPRTAQPLPKLRAAHPPAPKPVLPKSVVARIVDDSERSLVDVIDNLLNQGVMLNADIILALANVDLVYLRLSALLCAADRVLPRSESLSSTPRRKRRRGKPPLLKNRA